MQAIVTKYIPPTDTKGPRIKATAMAGSVIIRYDHELDHDEPFRKAAQALCDKFGWDWKLIGGGLPDGSMVWVQMPKQPSLADQLQSIAQGETWCATSLNRALGYCNNDAERSTIQAYLHGRATTDDRFRLQTIVLRIAA
jgi:hypothetical protein